MTTARELPERAAPTLRAILTEEELAATRTRVTRQAQPFQKLQDREVLADQDPLDDATVLEVHTLGEACGIWFNGREQPNETVERIHSDLQDFVAESRFGWGQLRP